MLFGVPSPTRWAISQRVSPILPARVIAWPIHHWSRAFVGFNASAWRLMPSRLNESIANCVENQR
jgi:hypothetical protein